MFDPIECKASLMFICLCIFINHTVNSDAILIWMHRTLLGIKLDDIVNVVCVIKLSYYPLAPRTPLTPDG